MVMLLMISISATAGDHKDAMKKEKDGTYIVNTTSLSKKEGYNGTTPLEIHIKKNKIEKIVALRNAETPKYYKMVKEHLFPKFVGMKVSKAAKADVDGVTGATFTSKAVIDNVREGAKYYQAHK